MVNDTITIELTREEAHRVIAALDFKRIHDPGDPFMDMEAFEEFERQSGLLGSLANRLRDQLRPSSELIARIVENWRV